MLGSAGVSGAPWAQDAHGRIVNCFCIFAHGLKFRQTCRQNRAIKNLFGRNLEFRLDVRMFHVKHSVEKPHFVPLKCAPESPPQGHGLVPCMFQLHVHRPRGVDFLFRLVRAESVGVRGDGLMYGLNERASCARSFSKSYKPDSSAERNPDSAGPSLCKNKGDRIFIAVSKRITGLGPATSTLARLRSTK